MPGPTEKNVQRGPDMNKFFMALSLGLTFAIPAARAADPDVDEKINALQRQIDELKSEVAGDSEKTPAAAAPAGGMNYEFKSAAEQVETERTAIGGYGEFVYNNYRDDASKDQADLKRFVLFFGHRFNDRIRLYSELEVEHAFAKDGKDPAQGEVAMEQAYIEYALAERTNLRTGLMMPSGILNEYHEPPVYFGVERNEIESRIIPTTWRELGVALQGGALEGIEYNAGISTTPDATQYKDAAKGFRDMRTSGSKAPANDLGFFAALNYRGVPGLLLGGSVFSGNTGHDGEGSSTTVAALEGVDVRLTLWELHGRYSIGGLDLRALYAQGSLGDTAALNAAQGITPASGMAAPESFFGWYARWRTTAQPRRHRHCPVRAPSATTRRSGCRRLRGRSAERRKRCHRRALGGTRRSSSRPTSELRQGN
jgi:hypothetical protein